MRPTWHFVLPDDIRWLLALTAPRVKAQLAQYDRRLGIDATLITRSHAVLETALRDGSHLTRGELGAALQQSGIPASSQRLGHLVMHAELDGVVVSGPRRGRQFTYGLLDVRAPCTHRMDRDEALAELTRRYFTGHGPAQVQDFVWWSGLTVADAKRGLATIGPALSHEVIGDTSYWSSPDANPRPRPGLTVHLLPNYDEFLVGYRDRNATLDPARPIDSVFARGSVLAQAVLQNGRVWGGWKRSLDRRTVVVEVVLLDVLDQAGAAALDRAAGQLGSFLGVPVELALER
jgi:hypothetical protein